MLMSACSATPTKNGNGAVKGKKTKKVGKK